MKGKVRAGSTKATAETSSAGLGTPTKPRELGLTIPSLCADKVINNTFLVYSLRPLDRGKAAAPAHVLCSAVTATTLCYHCGFSSDPVQLQPCKGPHSCWKLKAQSFLAKPDLHKAWISPKVCKAGLKLTFLCLRAQQALNSEFDRITSQDPKTEHPENTGEMILKESKEDLDCLR